MRIELETFTINKRFPLTISRGTTAQTTNLWIKLEHDRIVGWGEASPFSLGNYRQSTEILQQALQQIIPQLEAYNPWQRQQIETLLHNTQLPSAAKAAIDMALHDWFGKCVNLPLWQIWGLDCSRIVPTSVTIGINSPEGAQTRVRDWLQFADIRVIKVKLGNPAGIAADRAMFSAVKEAATTQDIFVDANGGWNLEDAIAMCAWLADAGVKYVEQPLPQGAEEQLKELKKRSPLPIFVDESCHTSADIPQLARGVDGINIKLMKAGGLTEAIRMVHTARAYGLQIMFGCYSDSALANTAAAQLAPLADYLDLDSHMNLIDDPFSGVTLNKGRVMPNHKPGLGVERSAACS
ncbi:dipeptide epimerase [Chroococcidiopsis sp. TS-821]|uniref:dipeptide epimerase n=1 Tax=Chroococcidiopsis sp. TS-821 TaxID=1378066 RepID=UPI000CEEAAF1|nr:dipeptide epimerase [Chroococcidiopsis sp. TS-821]PPS45088.1 dipeptide epimerase [Chroococcidiopsis sp. TS-821]